MLSPDEVLAFIAERDPHTVHAALGITFTRCGADECVVEVPVSERLFQHAGIVHGGVYVRPTTTGTLVARARPLHTGKSAIVYACDVENDGRLVSTGRCTIAIRPR